jgi:hypothetical protein
MLRRLVPVLGAALLAGTLAQPAGAVEPLGPAVTITNSPCSGGTPAGDAVAGPDGKAHGFFRFSGGNCDSRIWYVEGSGSSWTSTVSPYRGTVLAVATDTTGTYLLYDDGNGVRVTKRQGTTFTAGRALGGRSAHGDVIATGGRWWAVWSQQGRLPSGAATTDLWQAKTIGTASGSRRITSLDSNLDTRPSLAHRPGGGAVLFWSRSPMSASGTAELRLATSTTGDWQSRVFVARVAGVGNPQVTSSGRTTFLLWTIGRTAFSADNRRGSFYNHRFLTPAYSNLSLAASGGKAFALWNSAPLAPASWGSWSVFFAEQTSSGTWSGRNATVYPSTVQIPLALSTTGGKATLIVGTGIRLFARTQS